jgi:hypothetical protein
MLVTADTSQSPIGWLNADVENMRHMFVTADTSQTPMGWLNSEIENM